jgi:hypothetical protein
MDTRASSGDTTSTEGHSARRRLGLSLLLAGIAVGRPAQAQEDVQAQAVSDRARPEYDPVELRLGPVSLRPTLDASVSATDNVFARSDDRKGDVITAITPAVRVRYGNPLYEVQGTAVADIVRYVDNPGENSNDVRAEVAGRYGVGTPLLLSARVVAERAGENRRNIESFVGSRERIQRTNLIAEVGAARSIGRVSGSLSGRARRVTYGTAAGPGGAEIDYSFRDFSLYQVALGGAYDINGRDQITARFGFNRRKYDLRPGDRGFDPLTGVDRSSQGSRAELGLRRQISTLLYVDVSAGYLRQNFEDPRLRNVSGVAFSARLLWNVTPLTSISASAARSIDETSSPTVAGILRSEASVRIDHELLRNLVLSGGGRLASIKPSGLGADSTENELTAGARYLLNRRLVFRLDLGRYQRSSADRTITFTQNLATASVRVTF